MTTKTTHLTVAIGTAALIGGLSPAASAGQISDWHGQSERRLVEMLGNPNSQTTEKDGTRVYTYTYEEAGPRYLPAGQKSTAKIRAAPRRCQAEFQIGAEGRVIGARFVGQSCDIKS